ncbi:MAG: hypothetical protein ACFB0D_16730 [Phormidesmis sp.]
MFLFLSPLLLFVNPSTVEVSTVFEEEGNGSFTLELSQSPPSDEPSKDNSFCDVNLGEGLEWRTVKYKELRSSEEETTTDRCTYEFDFNTLEDARKLYQSLEIPLSELTINNNVFVYRISDQVCSNLTEEVNFRWFVETPGEIRAKSWNFYEIGANHIAWDLTSRKCGEMFVDSRIATNEPSPNQNQRQSSRSSKPSPFDLINGWTTIGASIATIVGTLLAIAEYRKRK